MYYFVYNLQVCIHAYVHVYFLFDFHIAEMEGTTKSSFEQLLEQAVDQATE